MVSLRAKMKQLVEMGGVDDNQFPESVKFADGFEGKGGVAPIVL